MKRIQSLLEKLFSIVIICLASLTLVYATNPNTPDPEKEEGTHDNTTEDDEEEPVPEEEDCSGSDAEDDDTANEIQLDEDGCPIDPDDCPVDPECIEHKMNLALWPNQPGIGAGMLRLYIESPESNMADLKNLNFFGLPWMEIDNIETKTDSAVITILQAGGSRINYDLANELNDDGYAIGLPMDGAAASQSYVVYVNAAGEFTNKSNADFIRHYRSAGGYVEYDTKVSYGLKMMTEEGREYDLTTLPIELISTSPEGDIVQNSTTNDGDPRQLKTPSGLVDIVVIDERSYEIRKYAPDQVLAKDADGLYQVDGEPIRVTTITAPSDTTNILEVVEKDGSYVTRYDYDISFQNGIEVNNQLVTQGAFVYNRTLNRQPTAGMPNYKDFTRTYGLSAYASGGAVKSSSSAYSLKGSAYGFKPVSSKQEISSVKVTTSGGKRVVFSTSSGGSGGSGGATASFEVSRSREYFVAPWAPNSAGRPINKRTRSGAVQEYGYDTGQRMISKSVPYGKASSGKRRNVTYGYAANVSSGAVTKPIDYRPRKSTRKLGGASVSRKFKSYSKSSNGNYVVREERAGTLSAGFGASGNKFRKRSYGISTARIAGASASLARASAGRLISDVRSTGSPVRFAYTENDDHTLEITKYSLLDENEGFVEAKSLRTITSRDVRGWEVSETKAVYLNGAWKDYEAITTDRNRRGKITKQTRLDLYTNESRVLLEQEWNGRFKSRVVDEQGVAMSYEYDDSGNMIKKTREAVAAYGDYPAQPAIVTTYTGDFQMTKARRPVWSKKIKTTTAGSLTLTEVFEYDAESRVILYTDENGLVTSTDYTDDNLIKTVTYPNLGTKVTTYNTDRSIQSITGTAVSVPEYYTYSANEGERVETKHYGSENSPRYVTTVYDTLDRVIRIERPAYGGGLITKRYTYGAGTKCGATLIEETGQPNIIMEYDSICRVIRRGSSADNTTLEEASATDQITDRDTIYTEADGRLYMETASNVYNTNNAAITANVVRSAVAGLSSTELAYGISEDIGGNQSISTTLIDRAGSLLTSLTTLPGVTGQIETYTLAGRKTAQQDPAETASSEYFYDDLGRSIGSKDPRHSNASQVTYTTDGSYVSQSINAAGDTISYSYAATDITGAGKVIVMTNPDATTSRYGYDLSDRVTHIWGSSTYPKSYEYGTYGDLVRLTTYKDLADAALNSVTFPSAAGEVTQWSYDPASSLMIQKTYPDGKGTGYDYYNQGNIKTRTWARGITTSYSYDDFNRLTSVDYSDAITPDVSYAYNRLGQKTEANQLDASGNVLNRFQYSYNAINFLQLQEDITYNVGQPTEFSRTLKRDYETASATGINLRYLGCQLTDGSSVEKQAIRSFDSYNRVASYSDSSETFTYAYHANNRNLITGTSNGSLSVNNTYELERDILDLKQNAYGSSLVSSFDYAVDNMGRRTTVAMNGSAYTSGQSINYGYNDKSEVTSADHTFDSLDTGFGYDAIGNRLKYSEGTTSLSNPTAEYQSNTLNQYTSISGLATNTRTHDTDGNLTSGVLPIDANSTSTSSNSTFTWDGENRLIQVTKASGTITNFSYDYQSRRISKGVDGSSATYYIYDGWNMIADYTAGTVATLAKTYTWGTDLSGSMQGAGGVGGLLQVTDHTSLPTDHFFPIYDGNGNISEYLDNTGTTVAHYEYSPFGRVVVSTGAKATDFEHKFSTKPQDAETGLYYYGYRYYDPVTGRWPSRDPINEWGGINLYGFVGNQPTWYVDYLGLDFLHVLVKCDKTLEITLHSGEGWTGEGKPIDWGDKKDSWTGKTGKTTGDYKDRTSMQPNGPTPEGWWKVGKDKAMSAKESSGNMNDGKGNSFKKSFDWIDGRGNTKAKRNNDSIRIHPDGGDDGTYGCVGISCKDSKEFKDKITDPDMEVFVEHECCDEE